MAPDKLTSALQQALVNRVEQAVKDGRLTREQADEVIARIKSGDLPLGGPGFGKGGGRGGDHGGFGRHGGGKAFGETRAAAAAYLGVTEEQLQTAREAGKSLADIAKEKGKTTDGLKAAMLAAVTKAADAAVTAKEAHQGAARRPRRQGSGLAGSRDRRDPHRPPARRRVRRPRRCSAGRTGRAGGRNGDGDGDERRECSVRPRVAGRIPDRLAENAAGSPPPGDPAASGRSASGGQQYR